jgi:CotS family spore coat protein
VNYERVQFYSDLISYGLNLEILQQIPWRVAAVTPETKNCFVLTTANDKLSLWLHQGREESLANQLAVMEHCRQQGFAGFLATVPLKAGRIYGKMDERGWFYLAKWARFERVSYRNLNHLTSIVGLITAFHNSVSGLKTLGGARFIERPKLPEKMREIGQCFAAFKMLATYRINPVKFDRLFLGLLSRLEESVAESLALFKNSKYRELVNVLRPDDLVINDFSRGNLRVDPAGQVKLLRLKKFRLDLPVMDLAVLLLKSGRSQRWERSWYEALLTAYQNSVSLTTAEIAIIKAYLCFPWNIYHLASRYYLNRVAWPNYLFNEKLERLIADEENRLRLMAKI